MNDLRTPLAIARGTGSAKDGTGHWWSQRLTAMILAPLSIWFLISVLGLINGDYADSRTFIAQPLNGVLLAGYVIAMLLHAQLGLQVVIEDYVHTRWLEVSLQILVKFVVFAALLFALFALVRILIGG